MKELQIKGLVTVEGMKFHEIEGGFGEGKKSMLAKEIAEIHGRPTGKINELINKNKKRFLDGVDVIDLKGKFDILLKDNEIYTQNALNKSTNVYLLSERGYSKLLKILDDDFAWEQYDKLVDNYFNMREIINSNEQLKAQLLLSIYKGGQEAILSTRQLVDIEVKESTKPLLDKIEVDKPKVNYYEDVLNAEGTMTTTQVAKGFNMTAQKLNNYLHDKKVQFKRSGMWMLYKEYDGQGYTDVKTSVIKKGLDNITTHYLVWTEKGRRFIYDLLLGDKLI